MPDQTFPGPIGEERTVREAVCVHSNKIYDSCKDKDCLEDLRVYLTTTSQEVLDRALSVKAKSAELVYSLIDVEPVSFNHGCYTVDVRYFYQVVADAFVGTPRPVEITGVSVFDKRIVLFGGESSSKTFSSRPIPTPIVNSMPTAFMEAVDPIVLGSKMLDICDARGLDCATLDLPEQVRNALGDELAADCDGRRFFVSLGQFSIIRLERDTQLLLPVYDYCLPEKECSSGDTPVPEDPCVLFRQVNFPVDEFFPPDGCCNNNSRPNHCDQSF